MNVFVRSLHMEKSQNMIQKKTSAISYNLVLETFGLYSIKYNNLSIE